MKAAIGPSTSPLSHRTAVGVGGNTGDERHDTTSQRTHRRRHPGDRDPDRSAWSLSAPATPISTVTAMPDHAPTTDSTGDESSPVTPAGDDGKPRTFDHGPNTIHVLVPVANNPAAWMISPLQRRPQRVTPDSPELFDALVELRGHAMRTTIEADLTRLVEFHPDAGWEHAAAVYAGTAPAPPPGIDPATGEVLTA